MQLGTLDCRTRSFAFLASGKKQMAIHNGYCLHLVIPSAFRAARKMQVDSFACSSFRQEAQWVFFSNIFAFCCFHKMQLGTADCGTRSFAFLAAGKKQTAIHNGYLLHVVIPSAFRAARKMQVDSFVSVLSDRKPNWFPSVTYLHSATVTKCSWELWIVGHANSHFKRLAKSRWQFITVTSCIWLFHLHLESLAKCKWILLRAVLSDRKLNGFSSVTYLHSAAFTKCSWELRIVGHGHLHF